MRPLISVAMITYNHEKFIEKAIESILSQKHNFEIEIIVGEDYSQDKTREKLRKYEKYKNIKIIKRNKNIGVVKNILEVYKECKGKYIALLEGDDYWKDEYKLLKMVNFLENNNYIGVFSEVDYVDENNNQNIIENNKTRLYKDIESVNDIFEEAFIPTCTLIFKNIWGDNFCKIYEKWLKNITYICDLQLKILLAENGKIKYFSEKMSAYRYITVGSTSFSSQNTELKIKDEFIAYKNISENMLQSNSKVENKIRILLLKIMFEKIKCLDMKSLVKIVIENRRNLGLLKILYIFLEKMKKDKNNAK
ncbi:glycosyltransferase [Cetobacterium somerae]|uniref:glycosyltransferase family 2 protein n=1 Tax=Cetobacterium somerae TaxID=188913 RepID=UPI002E7BEC53|nr:glycosyltransferase [Cetobacterium somerae]WVJ00701.1 glycosyltransferase [Cetobacterium somerae]